MNLLKRMRQDHMGNSILALFLVGFGVCCRVLPHPANFVPIAAIAIFGGAVLPRRLAVWTPCVAMVLSDLVIGTYDYRVMFVVWGCYTAIAWASSRWLRRPNVVHVGVLTVVSSASFFLVTNLAVWVSSGMYAHTVRGLIDCYTMAIPFFRNTVLSDAFFTSILFGALYFILYIDCRVRIQKSAVRG